ncbi:MAG: hypothetical protein KDA21_06890 [Phycisphaerales bacterium]|nr:hypothetical protein [Phycisphaerales bacterium]
MSNTTLADLPAPPFLERWFLEQPLVTGIILLAVGVILARVLYMREQGRAAAVSCAICAVLAVGTYITGTLVETQRETLERRTREFIETIKTSDEARARDYLAQSVSVSSGGTSFDRLDRDWMLSMVDVVMAQVEVTSSSFHVRGAEVQGDVGRTQYAARVVSRRYGGPHPTTWELQWQRERDGVWRIVEFKWLTYMGEPPDASWMPSLRTGIFN